MTGMQDLQKACKELIQAEAGATTTNKTGYAMRGVISGGCVVYKGVSYDYYAGVVDMAISEGMQVIFQLDEKGRTAYILGAG